MNDNKLRLTTELNGEITTLTDKETALLLDYRMLNDDERAAIQEFVENGKAEKKKNRPTLLPTG